MGAFDPSLGLAAIRAQNFDVELVQGAAVPILVTGRWFNTQIKRAVRAAVGQRLLPDAMGKLKRLPKLLDFMRFWYILRFVDFQRFTFCVDHHVGHIGRCLNEIDVTLLFEPLLDNLHVKHSEVAASESKSESNRRLGLKGK